MPTRTTQDTKTLIDHIATNRPELASDSGVIPCGISDHDIVYMVSITKLPKVKLQPKTLTTRNFKNFYLVQFRTEVDNIPFDTIRDVSSDVNALWQTWLDFFLAILNKHSPTVILKIRGKTAPYVTSEIRKMIRQRDFLNNKKRSHTQLDSRKQVIAFQDRLITINIKEAQHPLKREKQVIDKSSIMLKISTKSMHRVLV